VFSADIGDVDDGALPHRRKAWTVAITDLQGIECPGTPVAAGEGDRFLVPDYRYPAGNDVFLGGQLRGSRHGEVGKESVDIGIFHQEILQVQDQGNDIDPAIIRVEQTGRNIGQLF
jgi:hypothetical protein